MVHLRAVLQLVVVLVACCAARLFTVSTESLPTQRKLNFATLSESTGRCVVSTVLHPNATWCQALAVNDLGKRLFAVVEFIQPLPRHKNQVAILDALDGGDHIEIPVPNSHTWRDLQYDSVQKKLLGAVMFYATSPMATHIVEVDQTTFGADVLGPALPSTSPFPFQGAYDQKTGRYFLLTYATDQQIPFIYFMTIATRTWSKGYQWNGFPQGFAYDGLSRGLVGLVIGPVQPLPRNTIQWLDFLTGVTTLSPLPYDCSPVGSAALDARSAVLYTMCSAGAKGTLLVGYNLRTNTTTTKPFDSKGCGGYLNNGIIYA